MPRSTLNRLLGGSRIRVGFATLQKIQAGVKQVTGRRYSTYDLGAALTPEQPR